jgi:hypothetical protein
VARLDALKKCIMMQFLRPKTKKVHYNALFGGGKRQKKLSMQKSGENFEERRETKATGSKQST